MPRNPRRLGEPLFRGRDERDDVDASVEMREFWLGEPEHGGCRQLLLEG